MTDDRDTMADVDHTHPYDDRSAGQMFRRGPTVAADGGERAAGDDEEEGKRTMETVDHTPPDGEGANPAFSRGNEYETEEE